MAHAPSVFCSSSPAAYATIARMPPPATTAGASWGSVATETRIHPACLYRFTNCRGSSFAVKRNVRCESKS